MSSCQKLVLTCIACCCILIASAPTRRAAAAERASSPGVVCHIKVLSDKVEDVSSLEAWKRSFIKPGMTDRQKALAIWETVVKYRHQDVPPLEFLEHEDQVHDPI